MGDKRTDKATLNKARKAEAYQAFRLARSNGLTITASAEAAGVSRMTGSKWESQRKAAEQSGNGFDAARGPILARDELASLLSQSVARCDDQYRANMATALSRVMGYDAPTRQQIEVRQIPASVIGWLETVDAIDTTAEPAELSNPVQPKALEPGKPDTP